MFGNFGKIQTTTDKPASGKRGEWIGLAMLLILIGTAFVAGVSVGRSPTDAAESAKTNAQLTRIEAAIHSRACQEAVVDAAREPVQRP